MRCWWRCRYGMGLRRGWCFRPAIVWGMLVRSPHRQLRLRWMVMVLLLRLQLLLLLLVLLRHRRRGHRLSWCRAMLVWIAGVIWLALVGRLLLLCGLRLLLRVVMPVQCRLRLHRLHLRRRWRHRPSVVRHRLSVLVLCHRLSMLLLLLLLRHQRWWRWRHGPAVFWLWHLALVAHGRLWRDAICHRRRSRWRMWACGYRGVHCLAIGRGVGRRHQRQAGLVDLVDLVDLVGDVGHIGDIADIGNVAAMVV